MNFLLVWKELLWVKIFLWKSMNKKENVEIRWTKLLPLHSLLNLDALLNTYGSLNDKLYICHFRKFLIIADSHKLIPCKVRFPKDWWEVGVTVPKKITKNELQSNFYDETLNLMQRLMIKSWISHSAHNGPIFAHFW